METSTKALGRSMLAVGMVCVGLLACGCSRSVPAWDKCTRSSNWHGSNASWRMMNMLSPHMSDQKFSERMQFMKDRGCNTAHVILCNKADGECSGYSIYGNKFDFNVDQNYAKAMLKRVEKLRKEKFAVVLWLTTDDSTDWNRKMVSDPQRYISDLDRLGFLDYASTVVIGLEVDEYWSSAQCSAMYAAVKSKYKGKVGVHQVSGRYDKAGTCDIAFVQLAPGSSKGTIQNFVAKAKGTGKPVNMFELERQENREKSQWALDAGAFGVGNW